MKQPTDTDGRRKQWLWFVFLWCAGLIVTLALAYSVRFIIRLA